MAEREYRRLTRARTRRKGLFTAFATRSSLWLGRDHLLSIDSTGYTEEYKRFYFRDIQAVTLAKSKRRAVWNWVLGAPTAVCVGGWGYDLVSSGGMGTAAIVTGSIVTSFFAVPLLINNLLGPTCVCHLSTAVQREELPSLCRLRRARRILNQIRPRIVAAQGQLAPEEVPERMRQWAGLPAGAGPAAPPPAAAAPEAPPRSPT
jgi:hypothetical protein